MPRQLPWLNKGAGSRTQIKQTPKRNGFTKPTLGIDDDFFDGTVLAGSSKGKARAIRNNEDSDDELPDLPVDLSTTRPKSKTKYTTLRTRATSSSPPPIDEFIQFHTEHMHAGVSKFDLRDDEWMMVEDEFLETAKLFTRHLHIAEYKKLKEHIEAKKAQFGVSPARPVVGGGKMSFEGKMKEKAKAQDIKQKKAIRDVFASQNDENDDDDEHDEHASNASFARPIPRQTPSKSTTSALPRHRPALFDDSDSDDLDTSRPAPRRKPSNAAPALVSAPAISSTRTAGRESALPDDPTPAPLNQSSSFAKPALPTKQRGAISSRRNRMTPFDMLDGYTPPTRSMPGIHAHSATRSDSPAKRSSFTSTSIAPERSGDVDAKLGDDVAKDAGKHVNEEDERGTSNALRKATAERLAKRKAEREMERSEKRKTIKLEDIPTFLY